MKNLKYTLWMLAALFCLASCSDDDTPQLTQTVSPVLNTLPEDSIVTTTTSYTFTWSAPRFHMDGNQGTTGVGSFESQGINYDLQVDTVGGNFSGSVSVGQVVSKLYMNVKPADLQTLITTKLGINSDPGKKNLQFRIVATYGSNSTCSTASNTVRATYILPKAEEEPSTGDDLYEADFNDGITHQIYIQNNTGWNDLYIYAWNETGNMKPWPGVHYSDKVTIAGTEWFVFNMPSDYQHRSGLNYIFNDNGGNQFDAMSNYTFGHDLFLTLTSEKKYVQHAGPVLADGSFTVYANMDATGWPAVTFYAWVGSGNFDIGWPGHAAEGPLTINGKKWYYHTFASTTALNVILNNNGGGSQTADINTNHDLFVTVAVDNSFTKTSGLYK